MAADHLLVGELVNQHKQYEYQLDKNDRLEQVSAVLVEGQTEQEAAESRYDIKLLQVPHEGGKSSIVNLWGLRDFPHPPRVFPAPEARVTQPWVPRTTGEVEKEHQIPHLFPGDDGLGAEIGGKVEKTEVESEESSLVLDESGYYSEEEMGGWVDH